MVEDSKTFDAVVIGTGFAGAVTACRLVDAGFHVCVLERGRRYEKDDFPTYPSESLIGSGGQADGAVSAAPDFSRWLWKRDYGIYDVRDLEDVVSVQAAGYGGGSLIYANVHLRPPRSVFEEGWPKQYGNGALEPYFDLAAYMLRVAPVPMRLAKTLQLQRAAKTLNGESDAHWFRTPLAVNFEVDGVNEHGREQRPCDMRGRCFVGCDRQAKNSLDLNYLARAEQGGADIRTLAEVTKIERVREGFMVTYNDLLLYGDRRVEGKTNRECDEGTVNRERSVRGRYVFLCAGAVNTTELLLRNPELFTNGGQQTNPDKTPLAPNPDRTPLGSGYFPNADSLAAVFDCDEPHEADYGPTITSAVLHQSPASGSFSRSLDFRDGRLITPDQDKTVRAGMVIRGMTSRATATLAHEPIPDWGAWKAGDAAGALVLEDTSACARFEIGEQLDIGGQATAMVRSPLRRHEHWFLIQDGGYTSDLEPLVGLFRSPLWLRRNRFVEGAAAASRPGALPRRPTTQHLRLDVLKEAVRGTAPRAPTVNAFPVGALNRRGAPGGKGVTFADPEVPLDSQDLLTARFETFLPDWFDKAVKEERSAFVDEAAALALPMLGRLLDQLAAKVAQQLDPETVVRFGGALRPDDPRKVVLIRGMLRQALQVLGGSEAELATAAAKALLGPVPDTAEKLLDLLGNLALWAVAYGETDGHTAIILTMGRDVYRGRLGLEPPSKISVAQLKKSNARSTIYELRARLPGRVLDTSAAVQERALRVIASQAWRGELRTNPAWATLDRRLTVHSQGGCPMGSSKNDSVTDESGLVHECPGVYVMDAAAFPTSVGVNPSATVLAVAEYKIENFIRTHPRAASHTGNRTEWVQRRDEDLKRASEWVDPRRNDLDPLNPRHGSSNARNSRPPNPQPVLTVLGLEFNEWMEGNCSDVHQRSPGRKQVPEEFLGNLRTFRDAEDAGVQSGSTIKVELKARVNDLARLISTGPVEPVKIDLEGTVTLDSRTPATREFGVRPGSYLQMFVTPSTEMIPVVRFFCYRLFFDGDGSGMWTLNGVKVLRNDPGADIWLDTSTLYFEMSNGSELHRGILRLSLQQFLQGQLRSMNVTGTSDPMRRSWALVAFYKYFASEMFKVYAGRAETLTRLLGSAVKSLHV